MNTKSIRILSIATVLLGACLAVVGWATIKVVAWARDVPNRVVIDGDAIAIAIGQAATESYHHALRDGDPAVQLRVLEEHFVPLIRENDDSVAWIEHEFGDDITALIDSDDPRVSAAASDVLAMLGSRQRAPSGE